jgi:Domain of unknown function (DUF5134)
MMAGPNWARWVFALLFAAIAVHCALRLLLAHRSPSGTALSPIERTVVVAHLAMAAGMTVMFAPVATPVAPSWWAWGFGAHTAWLATRVPGPARDRTRHGGGLSGRAHLLTHVLAAGVMTYLFAAMPADGLSGTGISHAGHLAAASTVFAVFGWLAATYFLTDTVWSGIRIATHAPRPPHSGAGAPAPLGRRSGVLARAVAAATGGVDGPLRLVMGLGMSYMLLTML